MHGGCQFIWSHRSEMLVSTETGKSGPSISWKASHMAFRTRSFTASADSASAPVPWTGKLVASWKRFQFHASLMSSGSAQRLRPYGVVRKSGPLRRTWRIGASSAGRYTR
jgi:hypothetical protein